jgi:hypothetical protein
MNFPRTPLKEKLPFPGALRAFFVKGSGACRKKPVDCCVFLRKSLMLEQNLPTGWVRFYTGLVTASIFSLISSTNAFFGFSRFISLYLSLFKEEEEEEEGINKRNLIHRIEQLPKKASTGCDPVLHLIRGYLWMMFFNLLNGLSGVSGVIHTSTACSASGYPESGFLKAENV